jgi:ABC-type phosphate transport system substrate-binding protein
MKMIVLNIVLSFFTLANAHVIVVNRKNKIQKISNAQVKDIFLGEKLRWDDNFPVHLIDYSSNFPLRIKFTEEVIGVSIPRVYKTWVRLSLAGTSTPPKILRTEEEVVSAVMNDPYAIGYIDNAANLNLKEVKAIKIEN